MTRVLLLAAAAGVGAGGHARQNEHVYVNVGRMDSTNSV